MPSPFNKNFSLDNIIYNSYFNRKYCYINPNQITILGTILSMVAGYFMYTEKSFIIFVFLVILRTLCDIYDGIVARKCNKTSKIGKILDLMSDFLFVMMILIISLYKISNNHIIIKSIISLLIIIAPIFFILTENSDYSILKNNFFSNSIHDNTMVIVPLVSTLFYYLSIRFK